MLLFKILWDLYVLAFKTIWDLYVLALTTANKPYWKWGGVLPWRRKTIQGDDLPWVVRAKEEKERKEREEAKNRDEVRHD